MQICLSMYDILVTTRHYKVHNHKEVYPLLKTFLIIFKKQTIFQVIKV